MKFDRNLFVLFTLMLAALTVVALNEIFFSLPECPGGGDTCMMRDGHWEGSKLVSAILAFVWGLTGVWWSVGGRVAGHGGNRIWLLPFRAMAILVLLDGGFYFAVLTLGALRLI
jgi:hypothetical protein